MALNRQQSTSMFDGLKAVELVGDSKPTPKKQPKATQKKEKAVEKVENPITTSENNSYFKITKPVRETKSVRKQLVFTPTMAAWIKETAMHNKVSENALIENIIKMAMDGQ